MPDTESHEHPDDAEHDECPCDSVVFIDDVDPAQHNEAFECELRPQKEGDVTN